MQDLFGDYDCSTLDLLGWENAGWYERMASGAYDVDPVLGTRSTDVDGDRLPGNLDARRLDKTSRQSDWSSAESMMSPYDGAEENENETGRSDDSRPEDDVGP